MNSLSWVIVLKKKKKERKRSLNSQEIRLVPTAGRLTDNSRISKISPISLTLLCESLPRKKYPKSLARYSTNHRTRNDYSDFSAKGVSRVSVFHFPLRNETMIPFHPSGVSRSRPLSGRGTHDSEKREGRKKRLSPKGAGNPVGSRGEYRFTDY